MFSLFFMLMAVAAGCVLASLFLGLFVMIRGRGEKDSRRSNRIMQWRVGLQGLALALFLAAVMAKKSS